MVDVWGCQSGCHPFADTFEELRKMENKFIFKKYPSIEGADRTKVIDYIVQLGFDQIPWQVGLKVHGANFGIMTDGKTMEATKRSGFIVPDDGAFYGYQNVMATYQQRIFDFYRFLKDVFPLLDILTLYGELFGGKYGHPDVPNDPHGTMVQKGVDYCPHNDFFLFDIKVDDLFVNKCYTTIACNDHGFIGNVPLFQGSFRDCLQYPNEFPDPLHKKWNLPEIEGNICEGVIIEPEEPKFFQSGSRIILKNKNEKFAEKASHRKQRKIQAPHEWSEEGWSEVEEMFAYINENRLRNILSHIGEVTDKDFGRIMGMFAQDVFKDYLKDHNDEFSVLDKKEQDLFKKEMQRKCAECIRPNFRDIMDGTF